MTTKFKNVALILAVSLGAIVSSCEKDEPQTFAPPTIMLKELGENNSHEADRGDDLHIEADVTAEGRIAKIKVELHNEDGTGDEVEEEWTDMAGQLNGEFHEHIEIPMSFAAGDYHFHMEVIDQQGQTTEIDEEVEVK